MWVHVIREQVIKIDVLTFGNLGADRFRQRRQCAHVWKPAGEVGGLGCPGNLEEPLVGDWALVEVAMSRHLGILPTWRLSCLGGRVEAGGRAAVEAAGRRK